MRVMVDGKPAVQKVHRMEDGGDMLTLRVLLEDCGLDVTNNIVEGGTRVLIGRFRVFDRR